jgi:hypothetical protein
MSLKMSNKQKGFEIIWKQGEGKVRSLADAVVFAVLLALPPHSLITFITR